MTTGKILAVVLIVFAAAACIGAFAVLGEDDAPDPPTVPDAPEGPTSPEGPTVPEGPSVPEDPTVPDEPLVPDEPTVPDVPSDPVDPPVRTDGGISATGYSAEIPLSLFRGASTGADASVVATVSDPRVDIVVNDDSVALRGFSDGEFGVTVAFSDGSSSECTVSTADGSSRIAGRAADGTSVDSPLAVRAVYEPSGGSDWSYWTGSTDSPGVTDSVTLVSPSRMKELWKVRSSVDGGSTVWRTPGSAICVGEHTYYYDGAAQRLCCVVTRTGSEVASVPCASDSVYNMPLAHGDGKVFVPTHVGSATVVRAYDADTLEQLFVSAPISGGEVQGAITYRDGAVFFGTYAGCYACIGTGDNDTSRSDERVEPRWTLDAAGWYNSVPSFLDGFCVVIEKGYDIGGAVAYSIDTGTGAVLDSVAFPMEYCTSGSASHAGRVYIPLNSVTDKEHANGDSSDGKTLVIRSYAMNPDGTFDRGSETSWTSPVANGGTQSIPIIWNGRLYIGGGGGTLGTAEPFNVIDLGRDGSMTLAYSVSDLQTKGTASLTTAYSTSSNGDRVYIYLLEYGHVFAGESVESLKGYSMIYCLSDAPGQKAPRVEFTYRPSVDQFAYQSFSISPDGCLLIRNDSTLFCYGDVSRDYSVSDLVAAIDRIIRMSEAGEVDSADVRRAEARYSAMSASDRAEVSNHADLRALYRTVTLSLDGCEVDVRVLRGSTVVLPPVDAGEGRTVTGWTRDGIPWSIDSDRVTEDIVLKAVAVDTATVAFDPAGGSPTRSVEVVPGGVMGYVPEPTRDGYAFDGWFSGSERCVPQHSRVSSGIVLTAHWSAVSTVSFDSAGGSSAESIEVVRDRPVGELPVTKRPGYAFTGWWHGDVLFTADTPYPYDSGITLRAGWTENTESTVDTGKGVRVSGSIPESASVSIFEKSSANPTSSMKAIAAAAGGERLEHFLIRIGGDGIDGSQTFRVDIDAKASMEGRTLHAYCYLGADEPVLDVSGTVSGGVLTLDLKGATSSRGAEIDFGLTAGTGLADRV